MRAFMAVFAAGVCLGISGKSLADIGGSATYTSMAGSVAANEYDFTLHNTGSTDISVFWYAWDDSNLNFLPFVPQNIKAPAGWIPSLTYNYASTTGFTYGIEWYTFGSPLAEGDSLEGFSFESNEPPSFFTSVSDVTPVNPGDPPFPVGTSFVYMNYPAPSDGDAGKQFVAVPAPEPASVGLLALGVAGLLARRGRRW